MLTGCRVALDKIGANSLPIIVGETGWPSAGGRDTNVDNQKSYTDAIINFVGRSNLANAVYIFEAFDESEKGGAAVERNFGLGDESRNWKFDFRVGSGGGGDGDSYDRPCTQWGWKFYDQVPMV
jgi:hypothetical protein